MSISTISTGFKVCRSIEFGKLFPCMSELNLMTKEKKNVSLRVCHWACLVFRHGGLFVFQLCSLLATDSLMGGALLLQSFLEPQTQHSDSRHTKHFNGLACSQCESSKTLFFFFFFCSHCCFIWMAAAILCVLKLLSAHMLSSAGRHMYMSHQDKKTAKFLWQPRKMSQNTQNLQFDWCFF